MNGILSKRPGQGAIRLLVGSHGLLLVQSTLTLCSGVGESGSRVITTVTLSLAIPALLCALIGDGEDHDRPWRHRHGR